MTLNSVYHNSVLDSISDKLYSYLRFYYIYRCNKSVREYDLAASRVYDTLHVVPKHHEFGFDLSSSVIHSALNHKVVPSEYHLLHNPYDIPDDLRNNVDLVKLYLFITRYNSWISIVLHRSKTVSEDTVLNKLSCLYAELTSL